MEGYSVANNNKVNFKQLKKIVAKIPFAKDALALYYCSIDPKVPLQARLAAGAAIAYVVTPLDAIPDFMPIVGFTDDGGFVAATLLGLSVYITDEHRRKAENLLS